MTEGQLPARRIGPQELATLLAGWREDRPGAAGYLALASRLQTLILDGRLPVRTALPSERTLATLIGASRTLTTAAYRRLREDGFATGRHGAGTWTELPHGGGPAVWPAASALGGGDLSTAAPEAPPELHGALVAALADLPRLLPGHGYLPAGLPELRAAVAERYTRRGLPTAPEEVLVTSGAVQGVRLVLAQLLAPGDRVLVEDPTWPQALDLARAAGGRPIGLPVEQGWDAAAASALLRRTGARVAYLMPDAQNPTGRLLAGPGRSELAVALAEAGCTTVVDETLAELDLRAALAGTPDAAGTQPLAPFGVGGRRGTVIHVGSASKVFWGGLRVGWVRAERGAIERLITARATDDLGGAPVEQLATLHLLDQLQPLVARRRVELAARCRALQAALARELPAWQAPDPQAGMALWCLLPGPHSVAVTQAARVAGFVLAAGPRFGVAGGHPARVRLTFSAPPAVLEDSVRRLAAAVRELPGVDPEREEPIAHRAVV